jgi:hypothetical protein
MKKQNWFFMFWAPTLGLTPLSTFMASLQVSITYHIVHSDALMFSFLFGHHFQTHVVESLSSKGEI